MTDQNGKGSSRPEDIESGAVLYGELCEQCHGKQGVGDREEQIPKLQGQHYKYLMRQFSLIRGTHRGNADEKMVRQIQRMTLREQKDVMSYITSIRPPVEDLAKQGWVNPDFPNHDRRWLPSAPKY